MEKIKKIYLFAPLENQYGVVAYFTEELARALERQGVKTKILTAQHDNPGSFLNEILDDPPDCTLSFNGLLPDEEGRFLCDLINIPHVACLTDAPNHYFPLIRSPRNIITCVDQNFCETFQGLHFPHVIFLSHATSRQVHPLQEKDFQYDVLMLASFIDHEEIRRQWKEKYPSPLPSILEEAAEMTLSDVSLPYMQAFVEVFDKYIKSGFVSINPREINYEEILDSLETYIGGKSRTDLLNSLEGVTVHLFGSGEEGWKKHLKNTRARFHIHSPVAYLEALELMKKAKIVLNITPQIKRGGHERIFSGLACGSAVLTLNNPFMEDHFKDGEDILLFQPQRWDEVNRKLSIYLEDENKRKQIAAKGREKVMQEHTWDQRARTLLNELPALLKQISLMKD